MPDTVNEKIRQYLSETLGLSSRVSPWVRQDELPYYLQEAFDWREIDLAGHSVVLAIDRNAAKPSLSEVRSKLSKARSLFEQPIVYATRTLASYERRYLIDQKVPFVVPGNQLYLPDLGIDLREYFRKRSATPETTISPAAQAILIKLLLQPDWRAEGRPAQLANSLGYTPMTLSRALRELTTNAIVAVRENGRFRHIALERPPVETWQQALPLLRTPVKRIEWALPQSSPALEKAPIAGLSALASSTMLAEPRSPARAISSSRWKEALEAGLKTLHEWQPGAIECQIWRYEPSLGEGRETVDPLSLTLSLRDADDERIQAALDELKEQIPW